MNADFERKKSNKAVNTAVAISRRNSVAEVGLEGLKKRVVSSGIPELPVTPSKVQCHITQTLNVTRDGCKHSVCSSQEQ
jgi:hypothetical protein